MRIKIAAEAARELTQAVDYLENQRPGLGAEFTSFVEHAFDLIEADPHAWRRVSGKFHRFHIDRFRYSVIYRISADVVEVLAFAHDRQRPGYWTHRSD